MPEPVYGFKGHSAAGIALMCEEYLSQLRALNYNRAFVEILTL